MSRYEIPRDDDEHWMGLALEQAQLAFEASEVPIGCVIVQGATVIGRGWNRVEGAGDPTAHAEILALSAASATVGYTRLPDARVYVTLEPCLMCAGALLLARVREVIFGAMEPKFGALGSRVHLHEIQGFNHRYEVRGGVRADEASSLVRGFFRSVRAEGRLPDEDSLPRSRRRRPE